MLLLLSLSLPAASVFSLTLAESPDPVPAAGGQRFEFPEHGVAVTIPRDWDSRRAVPELPIFEALLDAREGDGPARCLVETFRFEGVSADDIAHTLTRVRSYRESQVSDVVGLPGGDAVRLYAPVAHRGKPGHSDTYVFETDDGYAWLSCSTTGTYPGHLWYTIARSMEFLPRTQDAPAEVAAPPTCREMRSDFDRDLTTGNARDDGEYFVRCVTCEELYRLVAFARVADIELARALLAQRCE